MLVRLDRKGSAWTHYGGRAGYHGIANEVWNAGTNCSPAAFRNPYGGLNAERRLAINTVEEPLFDSPGHQNYRTDNSYDEMFSPEGVVREHYLRVYETLRSLPAEEIRLRKYSADMSFLH